MSGASVVVLALNGRRQTVKCSPNTTILQVGNKKKVPISFQIETINS